MIIKMGCNIKNFHIWNLKSITIFCLFIGIVMLLIIGCNNSIADGIGDYPSPENADWVISSYTKVWNDTINLTGNLTIKNNGELIFNNVTLILNCSKDGEFHIEVQNGGKFCIYDYNSTILNDSSNITAYNVTNRYMFYIRNGAIFEMKNSELHNCGINESNPGLKIESDDVIIDNCTFSENEYAIHLNSSNIEIFNTEIKDNVFGITFNNSEAKIINCTIKNSIQQDFILNLNSKVELLNCTFDKNINFIDNMSNLTVKCFIYVEVRNSNGNVTTNASVNIQDNINGTFDEKYTTDENGTVKWIEITHYIQNKTNTTYFTPHLIIALKNQTINETSIIIDKFQKIVLILEKINPPKIFNVTYENLSGTSVNIIWETSQLCNSTVKYGKTIFYELIEKNETLTIFHSIYLTNLASETLYYFVVNSTNKYGISNESVGPYFITPDITKPEILNPKAINITYNSVIITWQTNEESDSLVKYSDSKTLPLTEWKTIGDSQKSKIHNIEITDLKTNKKYYYHVNSTDEAGNSNQSDRLDFKTQKYPLDIKITILYEYFLSNTTGNKVIFNVTDLEGNPLENVHLKYGFKIYNTTIFINGDEDDTNEYGGYIWYFKTPAIDEDIPIRFWVNASSDPFFQDKNITSEIFWIRVINISEPIKLPLDNDVEVVIIVGFIGVGAISVNEIDNPGSDDNKNIAVFLDVNFTGIEKNLKWLNINIHYKDDKLPENIREYKLKIYFWNETTKKWEITEETGVNENNNYVWANVTHLTIFAPRDEKAETIVKPLPKYPDLNLIKIEFSNNKPDVGDVITISVTIRNDGKSNASNFKVKFYVDKTEIGEREIISLSIRKITTIYIEWTAVKGKHNISAKLENIDNDSDKTNNEISKSIKIGEKNSEEDGSGLTIIIIITIIGIIVTIIILIVFKFDILGRYEGEEEDDDEEDDDEEIENEDESDDEDIDDVEEDEEDEE